MKYEFQLNDEQKTVDAAPTMPLLWALRDILGLQGTKFGCGIGQCGACTVHIDGAAMRSCMVPAMALSGKAVTTIEGLGQNGLHPLQEAWIEEDVPQCGYCQPGQIMAAAAMLAQYPNPTDEIIDQVMTNICRCGTYPRIRRAIHRVARENAAKLSPAEEARPGEKQAEQDGEDSP
jgi:isoquinoline 1-oxidoreductase subunit alpha